MGRHARCGTPPCTPPQHAQPHSHQHPGTHTPLAAKPKLYNPRHPEQTLLYRTVAEHFETWLELARAGQFDGQGDRHTPPAFVEQAFRKRLPASGGAPVGAVGAQTAALFSAA